VCDDTRATNLCGARSLNMTDDKLFSIGQLISSMWDTICVLLFSHVAYRTFSILFLNRLGGQTLESITGQILEFNAPVANYFINLIGASVCVVSAVIHLFLSMTGRKHFANKYFLALNISALVVLVSEIVNTALFSGSHQNL
jgi:hypothetical protein